MGYSHDIPGGAAWSVTVRAHRAVTFTALGDDANLALLLIGGDRVDRLNLPDTLKAQMSACVRAPMVLMSDRGLALASVTGSSLEWHDALTGFSARAGLVSELVKHGLGEADLHGCVNVFTKIAIDDVAGLAYVPGHCRAGDTLTLRTEQDVLLVAAATPHPYRPGRSAPAGVRVEVDVVEPAGPGDPSHRFRDESARALDQTRKALL